MAVTISTLVNTDTFGDWKDKTNDLIDMAAKTLTIGEGETNSGNVEISGNLTVEQTLLVDTIQPYTAGPNTIAFTGTVTATSFSGNGSGLTSIPASQLTGTVAAARLTGTYSIDIDGNAATATTATGATNIDIDATTSTDTTTYPVLVGANTTGNQVPFIDNAALSYNASNGTLSALKFVGDGSSLTGINTDLVDDTTPQLGGTLTSNGNNIWMADNNSVIFGSGGAVSDSQIYWNGSALKVDVNGGNLHIEMDGAANTDIVTITSVGANKFLFDASQGDLTVSGNITAFGSPSDIRLKENIEPITNALDKVSQLGGYTFNYKKDPNRLTGVIAQEVEKVLPEAIYTSKGLNEDEEEHLVVRYGNMVGLLIEAIKELKTEIEELKKR